MRRFYCVQYFLLCVWIFFSAGCSVFSSSTQSTVFPKDGVAERIILLPTSTPAHSQTVTWRTQGGVEQGKVVQGNVVTLAEISESTVSPALIQTAQQVFGSHQIVSAATATTRTETKAQVIHHRVTFQSLKPDTRYVYRVKGEHQWSEWLSFRTAADSFAPYRLIYMGDMQNHIYSLGARVMRAAFAAAPDAKLMLHAGDLTDRSGPEDQLWGEWFAAGSWMLGSMTQLPVVGNHEYRESPGALPQLRNAWLAHFVLPHNGPKALRNSVYSVDYQGVRYIILDSMAALHSEVSAQEQAQWLQPLLANNPNRWTIVSYHHPLFSGTRGQFNPAIARYWQPLFEQYSVDLVLQGDDHVYGRWQVGERTPVYTISVAGAKHNLIHPTSRAQMQRVGEDTQWYQVIDFDAERLRYRAWTVDGELYDAFDLVRESGKPARVETYTGALSPERVCTKPAIHVTAIDATEIKLPDGKGANKTRCWQVTELQ